MSATEQMRAMLDGLMGTARDGNEAKRQHLNFTDSRVCRAFLLDCCPHDIFASTKLELGECSKVHDPALRADYILANKNQDYHYEVSALERLQAFVNDADKKTEYLKRKLAETQEELTSEETSKLNLVHDLTEKLGKKLAQVDKAEAEGDVETKQKCLEEVERIKRERSAAELDYKQASRPASSHQQQNLRVCDVCSAYLGIHDNDNRLADHFGGKLHLGFLEVREKLEDLKKRVSEKGRDLEHSRGRAQHTRERVRDRDRERDRERDRDRDSHRERIRERDRDIIRDDRYRDRDGGGYYREPRYSSRSRDPPRDYPPRDSRDYPRFRDDRSERDRMDRGIDRSDWHSSKSSKILFDRGPYDKNHERENQYQRKLRDWEKREMDKARKYAIREKEERERKLLEEQESKKLKEFLEDYKDDRDDIRFYRGSALARRLADRRKEIELDENARRKEKTELEMLSKSCAVTDSTPQAIEISNNTDQTARNQVTNPTNGEMNNNLNETLNPIRPEQSRTTTTTNITSLEARPSTANPPDTTKGTSSEDKRKLVEELIAKIPTDRDQLFARKLEWAYLDENLMAKRIRPWITKKIAEYMGEKEAELIDFVCALLNDQKDANSMLKEVAIVLDDEAEKFVVNLWRLLIFELEAKKIGLRK